MSYESLANQMVDLYRKAEGVCHQRLPIEVKNNMEYSLSTIEKQLNQFRKIRGQSGGKLRGEFSEEMEGHTTQIQEIINGLEDSFLLFLVGMGKFGKSTLLNALLEDEVAAVDILPKTWKIDVYQKKKLNRQPLVCYRDGKKSPFSIEKVRKLIDQEEEKRQISEKTINAIFRQEKDHYQTIEEKEELKKLLTKDKLYHSDITEVRWPIEDSRLLNKFNLVDTPGLNQNLLGETKISLQEYYHKADGVLWMLDATKLSSLKGKEMIQDLQVYMKEVGGSTNNIIGVINFADRIRKTQGEEGIRRIVAEAKRIFKGYFLDVVCISAKEAFEGAMTGNTDLIKASRIQDLQHAIDQHLYKRAQSIQIESKKRGVQSNFNLMKNSIDQYLERLTADEVLRKKVKNDFDKEMNNKKALYTKQIDGFIKNYSDKTMDRISNRLEKLIEKETSQERIQEEIFKIKEFNRNYEKKFREIITDVNSTKDFYIKQSTFKEYQHIPLSNQHLVVNNQAKQLFETISNMNLNTGEEETVSTVGIAFAGAALLGPVGLILGGLAHATGISKFIAVKWKTSQLKRKLQDSLSESEEKIKNNFHGQLQSVLEEANNDVTAVREETFTSLYGNSTGVDAQVNVLKSLRSDLFLKEVEISSSNLFTAALNT